MSGHKIVVITTNLRNLQNIQPAFEICAPFFSFQVIAFPLETDPTSDELSRFPQVELCKPLKTLKPKRDELEKLQNDLRSVLKRSGAKAVLLTDVQASLAKTFYDVSFKEGIPVIGTQHGIVQTWQKIAQLQAFDCLFLFSPAYRTQIRSNPISFCALPRLDLILRARENQRKNQLLFFAQKMPIDSSLTNFFNELKNRNGISTIVRPHPQFGVKLSNDLQEADLPFKVERKPIAEQISSSDFTLSDHSTAMIESLWLNCKALLLPGSKASILSNYPGELSSLTPQAFKKCLEDFDKNSISELLGQLVYSSEPVHREIFLSAMWRFFWLQVNKGETYRSSWKKRFREFTFKINTALRNKQFTENDKRNVLHISISPIAGSPERLSNLISEQSKIYNSLLAIHKIDYEDGRVFGGDVYFNPFGDQENLKRLVKQADVIHFHNESYFCLKNFLYPEIQDKAIVLQWHSGLDEMAAKTGLPTDSIASWDGVRQIVVAQAQREDYPNAIVVPNVPFYSKFESGYKELQKNEPIQLIYSPTGSTSHFRSSQKEQADILQSLNELKKLMEEKIEINIMEGLSLKKHMSLRSKAHIGIDDINSGGYQLSTLENLLCGVVTINNVGSSTLKALNEIGRGSLLEHVIACDKDRLIDTLIKLANDRDELEKLRKKAFGWARESWSKEWCLSKYEEIYALAIEENEIKCSRFKGGTA